jgi:hypothetical protein
MIMDSIAITREDMMPRMRAYLSRAGYRSALTDMSDGIKEIAREIYHVAMNVADPFIRLTELGEDEVDPGILPNALNGSDCFTLILLSLGGEIDDRTAKFFDDDEPLRALLMDSWGSEAIETMAANVDRRLRACAWRSSGTIRFAPGRGGLDIRLNSVWMNLAKERSSSQIMMDVDPSTGIITPRKSIICMIGWSREV